MKKSYWWAACLLALGFVRDAPRAVACGSAYVFSSHVVGPPQLFQPDETYYAGRVEEQFLYPYLVAHPREADLLWKFSYDGVTDAPAPDQREFQKALAGHDVAAQRRAALAWIERWYALPPTLAAPHRAPLMQAVQVVEQGASPSPSQQFLELMREFETHVPNGWASSADKLPRSFWVDYLARVEVWLKNNPQHPLRDLVALWRVRVHRFAGNEEAAWATLFQLYPRRRLRVIAEMRYLMQQGTAPNAAQLDALNDPLLIALFANQQTTTPKRLKRWWQISERAPTDLESVALQERLLSVIAERATKQDLPAFFPKKPGHPTQYWGKLRALALMRRRRFTDAEAQLAELKPEAEQAALLAHCYVAEGKPELAARTPELARPELYYLMQVLVPRNELPQLRADSHSAISAEATSAAAVELLARDDFKGAAHLLKLIDPGQAQDLEQMASLSQRGDKLGLARTLRAHAESLGAKPDSGMYRGISLRYAELSPKSAEAQAITHFLESTTGGFHALAAYVEWLEANPTAPNARAVLDEADHVYTALGAYGSWSNLFWQQHLAHHDLAIRLRKIGKRLRHEQP